MMKKLLRLSTAFCIGFILFWSCKNESPEEIKSIEWLVGTWENKTPRGSIYETWTKVSKDLIRGKSYAVVWNDTIVFETISLVWQNDSLFYIPSVKNQNNGLPVRFAQQAIYEKKMIFENPAHDFPHIISYIQVNKDSLMAEISGINKGEERRQSFPMKRVK